MSSVREDLAAALARAGDSEERASRLLLELREQRAEIEKLTAQLREHQILAAPVVDPQSHALGIQEWLTRRGELRGPTADELLQAAWAQQREARERRAICVYEGCILTGGHAGWCSRKWQTYVDPTAATR